ncbi:MULTISPECIES: hypothetical protein [unclassified Neisseria]|uniref:hypothetical protein n=1 Tax=unclassified Neisseria TaxID=2623750 RepID=UPI001072A28F|nr:MULTISPECIES: hypothetical protein [unclassified Neisseria]MBF0804414.1 hypothetical protein [Neisseria sp. 19428wB4_WF04]TFU42786.1 hypothetical protein E4T99_08690 [Neisseria sp. WF04]
MRRFLFENRDMWLPEWAGHLKTKKPNRQPKVCDKQACVVLFAALHGCFMLKFRMNDSELFEFKIKV